jgi:putative transposase
MARQPRLIAPGLPHHVVQRGHNRQAVFLQPADRAKYLDLLFDHALRHRVAVHAFVLMDNHTHLLATPEAPDGLSKMMQALGREYVQTFNALHGRSGTVWEGRYRSTVVETERYLLACMVYIDLNPVRAGMVAVPAEFGWSSHRHWVGLQGEPRLTPHPVYWALGNTPFAREAAYRDMVHAGLSSEQVQALTNSALSGWVLGHDAFVQGLAAQTTRRIVPGRAGRPFKAHKA